jgi:hypothetical protein
VRVDSVARRSRGPSPPSSRNSLSPSSPLSSPWRDAKPQIVASDVLCNRLHRRLEVFIRRIDVEPLSEQVMRLHRWKVGSNRGMMLVVRADQHAMPLPAAGPCRLGKHQHQALVEVRRKPSEHLLGEEARLGWSSKARKIHSLSNAFIRDFCSELRRAVSRCRSRSVERRPNLVLRPVRSCPTSMSTVDRRWRDERLPHSPAARRWWSRL